MLFYWNICLYTCMKEKVDKGINSSKEKLNWTVVEHNILYKYTS